MKRLPLGIQTFEQLIDDGYLYVDKTAAIHELLATAGKVVFLSRPRRFGKSLLCSTLASLFEGRRELFANLAINDMEWSWDVHPVIRIDFNAANYMDGKTALNTNIETALNLVAKKYDVSLTGKDSPSKFTNLVVDLYCKYNQKVAVIIDEYDKPLLNTLDAPDIHIQLRDELKGFFGVLKSQDAFLKFSFITGVTRFSKVSIFSDLNQLDDVSFNPKYADICGITQEELEDAFAGGIVEFAQTNSLDKDGYIKKLRQAYNGYRFSKSEITVYNPFGIIKHFVNSGEFGPYWFDSGTPTFLYKLMKKQSYEIPDLEGIEAFVSDFTNFDVEGMQLVPLLYQSGYLTIKDYDEDDNTFKLGFPNEEVSSAFSSQLLKFMFPDTAPAFYTKLPSLLNKGNLEDAMRLLKEFLSAIPYDVHDGTERYYHSMIDLIFRIFGLNTRSEVRIASGRIDTLVETKKFVYCFEFKINKKDSEKRFSPKDALAQIDTKEYLTPWQGSGKKLFKVGVVFDSEKRNIDGWVSG
jgi:hypothetical protein